jgi:hypothetical protein
MPRLMQSRFLNLSAALLLAVTAVADKPVATEQALVAEVITAAGGEEHLLQLFEFRERVLITAEPAAPVTADEPGNRTSVVQVGGDWWIGTGKRDKDKVRVLCWAWSLRILLAPESIIASLPEATIGETPAFGLRVTESVAEPIDLYFDAESKRLLAIDYTDTRHLFSDWKATPAGHHYPAHVVGYRFTDSSRTALADQQWYQTDILELTPLAELPAALRE